MMKDAGGVKAMLTIGAFFITLMSLGACGKGKSTGVSPAILSPLDSTHKLARTWVMHGYEDTAQIDVYFNAFSIPDTSMPLSVINDSTVGIGSIALSYNDSSSNDSMICFWHTYLGPTPQTPEYQTASVYYYFQKDSLVVDLLVLAVPNGYVERKYHSY